MSSRLTKHRHDHRHPSQTRDIIPLTNDDKNNVTYYSKNKKDGRGFEAVSPPNSIHAQKLAELAMLVQTKPQPVEKRSWFSSALGLGAPVVVQRPAVEYRAPAPQLQQSAHVFRDEDRRSYGGPAKEYSGSGDRGFVASTEDRTQTHTPQFSTHQDQVPVNSSYSPVSPRMVPENKGSSYISDLRTTNRGEEPRPQITEVRRYATENQMSYKVSTESGEMRVGAPFGSNEARSFDGIAESASSKERLGDKDKTRRLSSRSRRDDREGRKRLTEL